MPVKEVEGMATFIAASEGLSWNYHYATGGVHIDLEPVTEARFVNPSIKPIH